jgi:hypothetical protein
MYAPYPHTGLTQLSHTTPGHRLGFHTLGLVTHYWLNILGILLCNCIRKHAFGDVLQDVFGPLWARIACEKLVAGAQCSKSRLVGAISFVRMTRKRSFEPCHAPNDELCEREYPREGRISLKVDTLDSESEQNSHCRASRIKEHD